MSNPHCRNPVDTSFRGRFVRFMQRRGRDESGAVTVEFVLWVPVFVLILALTVDASILFMTQSNLWTIARDTTRHMATGLYSNTQAEAYAQQHFDTWGYPATVVASSNGNFVSVRIEVPVASVAPFRIVGAFTSGTIRAEISQRREPN